MFRALEMKQALINAHIDLSAIVIIMKTLLSLAQEHQITLLGETTDWPTHIMKHTPPWFGEELKNSTDQFGTKFATMTLKVTMQ
jgi:hypothetical protein